MVLLENYQAPDWLVTVTHVVRFNPNCPAPFEVRLVGRGAGLLDLLPHRQSNDAIGHGPTLGCAARQAKLRQESMAMVRVSMQTDPTLRRYFQRDEQNG